MFLRILFFLVNPAAALSAALICGDRSVADRDTL
jgi:hypothetical protein